MLARSLALAQRVAFRTNTVIPSTVFKAPVINIQTRNLITIMTEDDEGDDDLIEFANHAENMGSNSHPGYKREALMKSEKRKSQKSRKIGKRANHKVRALVDFIEFKNSHKFQ